MKRWLWLLVICLSAWLSAETWQLEMSGNTSGKLRRGQEEVARLSTNYFLKGWRGGGLLRTDHEALKTGRMKSYSARSAPKMCVELTLSQANPRTVHLDYRLEIQQDVELNTIYANYLFPTSFLLGQTYTVDDDQPVPFPERSDNPQLFFKTIRKLTLTTKFGPLTFRFARPTGVLLQDSRQWNDYFSLRIGSASDVTKTVKAGEVREFSFDLELPESVEISRPQIVVMKASEDWIPLTPAQEIKPGSALDFSRFGFTDAPAGKHGQVRAVGKHFEFERLPGVSQRFYGVNFVGMSQYLSHERATQLADRLLRLGYNTVRFHHHENSLLANWKDDTTKVNPERLDQLEFFFAELKKRGIYATTDLFVSRRIRKHDIWPGTPGEVSAKDFKKLLVVNRAARENLKQFARNFLGHRSPYTGMTLAEDPAMAWISLINENTPNLDWARMSEPVKDEYLKAYNEWLSRKYASPAERNQAWKAKRPDVLVELLDPAKPTAEEERDFCLFLEEKFKALYDELKAFLRDELKCKALLTDMNFALVSSWTQDIRARYDYIDHHFYIDHPTFVDKNWQLPSTCPNASVIANGTLGGTYSSFARMFDRPFTLSEYNYSGPGRYRGIGGILTGCLGAIQDWAAIWRFAYAHGSYSLFTPTVTNYFDMSRDPLNQCAERATLMLYLRQDMKPAEKSIAITMSEDHTRTAPRRVSQHVCPSWKNLVTLAQVGTAVGDTLGDSNPTVTVPLDHQAATAGTVVNAKDPLGKEGMDKIIAVVRSQKWLPEGNLTDFSQPRFPRQQANGELTILPQQNTMLLDTARTAGGFAPAGVTLNTRSLDIAIRDTDATVWVSALDDQPITSSRHLLLTHLTDLVNTNMTFAEKERRTLLNWGVMPQLVRQGRAIVTIKHGQAHKVTAWALRLDGERLQTIPVTKTADGFQMDVSVKGPDGARMLYEIVVE